MLLSHQVISPTSQFANCMVIIKDASFTLGTQKRVLNIKDRAFISLIQTSESIKH